MQFFSKDAQVIFAYSQRKNGPLQGSPKPSRKFSLGGAGNRLSPSQVT